MKVDEDGTVLRYHARQGSEYAATKVDDETRREITELANKLGVSYSSVLRGAIDYLLDEDDPRQVLTEEVDA